MKFKALRTFMKKKKLDKPYTYANKALVVDGQCFKEIYKNSGCQFILGGEYDRFASYLKNILSVYIKSNIDCYVVFNGAMKADIKTRKDIHQKIIDRVDSIEPDNVSSYCEPIFVKDVYKDVLEELGIKYYTCMYDSREILFSLAKKLNCPILSSNLEYAFYNVSVINFKSVVFHEKTLSISCSIYHSDVCRQLCPVTNDVMTVALIASDEDSDFYGQLPDIFKCRPEHYIASMLHWMKRQNKENAIRTFTTHLNEDHKQVFMETYGQLRRLFVCYPYEQAKAVLTSNAKTRDKETTLSNKGQFEYNVSIGRVAIPFINLKNVGTLSGSWVVGNKNRDDAMLVVIDIAHYAQGLLTGSNDTKITFIGRQYKCHKSDTKVFKKIVNIPKETSGKKNKRQNDQACTDHFKSFVTDHLPGFDFLTLERAPEDCWILLISLLYYRSKTKRDIMTEVYCFLLSYVLLGPVSENVGVIKRSNFSVTHGAKQESDAGGNNFTHEESTNAARAVIDLFYLPESGLTGLFDRDILHTFAEIQHCLQYMNYLNRLCGERIKCTSYHRAINCTFINNLYSLLKNLKDKRSQRDYIQNILNCTPVYLHFRSILNTYIKCLAWIEAYEL